MFVRVIVGVLVVCLFLCVDAIYGQVIMDPMVELPVEVIDIAWKGLVGVIIFALLLPIVCGFALCLFIWLVVKVLRFLWNVIFGTFDVSASAKVPGIPASISLKTKD